MPAAGVRLRGAGVLKQPAWPAIHKPRHRRMFRRSRPPPGDTANPGGVTAAADAPAEPQEGRPAGLGTPTSPEAADFETRQMMPEELINGECKRHTEEYHRRREGCDECWREARSLEGQRANFARAAMVGLLSKSTDSNCQSHKEDYVAKLAVLYADALIAELSKPKTQPS